MKLIAKKGATSWEEIQTLDRNAVNGEFTCPNLERKREFYSCKILTNFKNKLEISCEKLNDAWRSNSSLLHENSYDAIEK